MEDTRRSPLVAWELKGKILAMQDTGMKNKDIAEQLGMRLSTMSHKASLARHMFDDFKGRGERGCTDGERAMFDAYDAYIHIEK